MANKRGRESVIRLASPLVATTPVVRAPRHSLMAPLIRKLTPASLMMTIWIIYLLVMEIGPVQYNQPISWASFGLLFACVGAFVFGSRLAENLSSTRSGRGILGSPHHDPLPFASEGAQGAAARPALLVSKQSLGSLDPLRRVKFNKCVRGFAFLGLVGTFCIAVDKVFIGGLNIFQNLGDLRLELNVDSGMPSRGTILMWIGMAIYSFANIALMLFVLEGELCEKSTARLAAMASFCPGLVILLYGGRSSAIFVLILMVGGMMVRVHCRQSAVPRAHYMRPMFIVHLLLVLLGSLHMYSSRAVAFGYSDNGAMVHQFSSNVDATISPTCEKLISGSGPFSDLVANLLMTNFYFTHGFPEMDYLLTVNHDAGPFFGRYQGWFLYRVFVELLRLPNGLPEMEAQIHHSGLFFSAWGGMLLDFGPWGAPVAICVLGLISGLAYDRGVRCKSTVAKLVVVYSYLYVFMTPIHSVFSIGNAMQILVCIAAAGIVLKRVVGSAKSPVAAIPQIRRIPDVPVRPLRIAS